MSSFKKAEDFFKNTATSVANKWREASTRTKLCIIAAPATAVVTAVAAPLLVLPALGAVGFTSAGVAAGSIAASVQTATTVSGSIFALCQSAAATGIVAASTSAGVGLAAGATAAGITVAACSTLPSEPSNGDQGPAETENDDDPDNDSQGLVTVEEREAVPEEEEEEDQSLDFQDANTSKPELHSSLLSSIL